MFGGMNPHLDYILYQLSYIKFVGEPVHLLKVHMWKMSCLPIVSCNYVQWKLSTKTPLKNVADSEKANKGCQI